MKLYRALALAVALLGAWLVLAPVAGVADGRTVGCGSSLFEVLGRQDPVVTDEVCEVAARSRLGQGAAALGLASVPGAVALALHRRANPS